MRGVGRRDAAAARAHPRGCLHILATVNIAAVHRGGHGVRHGRGRRVHRHRPSLRHRQGCHAIPEKQRHLVRHSPKVRHRRDVRDHQRPARRIGSLPRAHRAPRRIQHRSRRQLRRVQPVPAMARAQQPVLPTERRRFRRW